MHYIIVGIRIHDTTFGLNKIPKLVTNIENYTDNDVNNTAGILKMMKDTVSLKPSTIEVNMEIWNNQIIIEKLLSIIKEALFMVHISTTNDLERVLKYHTICKGIVINNIKRQEVSIDNENNIKNLISNSKNFDLLVQTNIICNCLPYEDGSENYNLTEILPVIANLADYGSDIIMINLSKYNVKIEGNFA